MDPFDIGLGRLDRNELQSTLRDYKQMRARVRRVLLLVIVRNYTVGAAAFIGFWIVIIAPLALLYRFGKIIAIVFTVVWMGVFVWMSRGSPLEELIEQWTSEANDLRSINEMHSNTISSIREHLK